MLQRLGIFAFEFLCLWWSSLPLLPVFLPQHLAILLVLSFDAECACTCVRITAAWYVADLVMVVARFHSFTLFCSPLLRQRLFRRKLPATVSLRWHQPKVVAIVRKDATSEGFPSARGAWNEDIGGASLHLVPLPAKPNTCTRCVHAPRFFPTYITLSRRDAHTASVRSSLLCSRCRLVFNSVSTSTFNLRLVPTKLSVWFALLIVCCLVLSKIV